MVGYQPDFCLVIFFDPSPDQLPKIICHAHRDETCRSRELAIRTVPRRYVDENCGDQISGRGATWGSETIHVASISVDLRENLQNTSFINEFHDRNPWVSCRFPRINQSTPPRRSWYFLYLASTRQMVFHVSCIPGPKDKNRQEKQPNIPTTNVHLHLELQRFAAKVVPTVCSLFMYFLLP